MVKYLTLLMVCFILIQCDKEQIDSGSEPDSPGSTETSTSCDNPGLVENKIYSQNGQTFLWGGDHDEWDFNITDWILNECQLNFGLGREHFPALIEPQYTTISELETNINENEKCLVLNSKEEVKIYPFSIMLHHEIINEISDGEAIMVAYCVLADLAAVYTRNYCGNELTFGTSGYTYHDKNIWNDLDAFVLWDRETESLWWPLIDMGVSGLFKSVELKKHDETKWEEAKWKDIKVLYPDGKVLLPNQTQNPPIEWSSLPKGSIDC